MSSFTLSTLMNRSAPKEKLAQVSSVSSTASLRPRCLSAAVRQGLAAQFGVHPTQITEWKQQLLARAADVFGGNKPTSDAPDLKALHAKIGQLALENDFLEGTLTKAGLLSARR